MNRELAGLTLIVPLLLGGLCSRQQPLESVAALAKKLPWDAARVARHLAEIAAEPHPMGSLRQQQLANYLSEQATQQGLRVFRDSFTTSVPDPAALSLSSVIQKTTLELSLTNVIAKLDVPGSSCAIMLGSHYDAKRLDSGSSLGANDSGSSSAALLEIMRILADVKPQLACSVYAVWFDGEEAYLNGWRDGETQHPAAIVDHLYGSRHLAEQLTPCAGHHCLPAGWGGERLHALVLLDMIGMPGVRLTSDLSSDPRLLRLAQSLDQLMYGGRLFAKLPPKPITDDHIPFMEKGIPALDLIDFENLSNWHTPDDKPETLSADSIRDVALLASALTLALSQEK